MQAGGRVSRRGNGVACVGLIVALSRVGQNPPFLAPAIRLGGLPGLNPDLARGQSRLPLIDLGHPLVTWSCRV
jgi:hypothetical protein